MKYPRYIKTIENQMDVSLLNKLDNAFKSCTLCPRKCGVNRSEGETGACGAGNRIKVASISRHYGEEPAISGTEGSGTIFFSFCTLKCCYCQNYEISHYERGYYISESELADEMLNLQKQGVHNINLVTPGHYLPLIIKAVFIAAMKGLNIPIVYNTGGYENPEIIKLLEGIVDIYLPDMKYSSNKYAQLYSGTNNYEENNRNSILEMYRQARDYKFENEIIKRGLIIRHLVLPNNIAGSRESFEFVSRNLSKDVYFSIMSQYFPAFNAQAKKKLCRPVSRREYNDALEQFEKYGLHNGWQQEHSSASESYVPYFHNEH